MNTVLSNIPHSKQEKIIEEVRELTDEQKQLINGTNLKNSSSWFALYWFFPLAWIFDRVFLGDYIFGIVKILAPLIASGLLFSDSDRDTIKLFSLIAIFLWFFWVIIDGFNISRRVRKSNYRKVLKRIKKMKA